MTKPLRFILAGGSVLLLTLILTYTMTEILGLYYLYSYIIVLTITTAVNFFLGSKFVFKTETKHLKRFFYYLSSILIFYVSDIFVTKIFTETIGFHYTFSIFLSKGIIFFTKYFFYDRVIFRDSSFLYKDKNSI